MYLAEAKRVEAGESARRDLEVAIEDWHKFPPSVISDHGDRCCRIAMEWLFAMDFCQMSAGHVLAGPRWIRQRIGRMLIIYDDAGNSVPAHPRPLASRDLPPFCLVPQQPEKAFLRAQQ